MNTKWLLVVVVLVVAIPASAAEIGLGWDEVIEGMNGEPIAVTQYKIFWKLADTPDWLDDQVKHVTSSSCGIEEAGACHTILTGLQSGTEVDIRVHAYSAGGESPPSNTLRTSLSAPRPAAPQNLRLWVP